MTAAILILAGRREGHIDPLAAEHGLNDKALVPVAGRPMLAHVLDAAAASKAERIFISTHNPDLLDALADPIVQTLGDRLTLVKSADNLADSVLHVADLCDFPLLITTADNCLLTADAINEISANALSQNAEAAIAMARKEDVLAVHPTGQRKFYKFSDVELSNCNCYWISARSALRAAEVFRGGGQFVKKPMRVLQAFGLLNLLRFRFGMGEVDKVFAGLGRKLKMKLVVVQVSDGHLAIDVDHQRSLLVTEELMAKRRS